MALLNEIHRGASQVRPIEGGLSRAPACAWQEACQYPCDSDLELPEPKVACSNQAGDTTLSAVETARQALGRASDGRDRRGVARSKRERAAPREGGGAPVASGRGPG